MLKVGDKVKFLNSRGGGVVARVIDPRMVAVATEEGFEIPTLVSELIRVEPGESGARFFDESFKAAVPEMQKDRPEEEDDRLRSLPGNATRHRKKEELFLAFVPHDQKWLITGLMDVFLVNNTSWDVLYNLFLRDENDLLSGTDYGSLFAGTSLLVRTIDRDQLPRWTHGLIQFLFHKETTAEAIPPFHAEFRIEGRKFYRETSFREHPLTGGKAMIVRLFESGENPAREV